VCGLYLVDDRADQLPAPLEQLRPRSAQDLLCASRGRVQATGPNPDYRPRVEVGHLAKGALDFLPDAAGELRSDAVRMLFEQRSDAVDRPAEPLQRRHGSKKLLRAVWFLDTVADQRHQLGWNVVFAE
jgi:hypothetical protein